MSLVRCLECGREMSTYAEACPGCGFSPRRAGEARAASAMAQKTLRHVGYAAWVALGMVAVGGMAVIASPRVDGIAGDYCLFVGWTLIGMAVLTGLWTLIEWARVR